MFSYDFWFVVAPVIVRVFFCIAISLPIFRFCPPAVEGLWRLLRVVRKVQETKGIIWAGGSRARGMPPMCHVCLQLM